MTQLQSVQAMIDEKLEFGLADLLGWVNAWDGIRLVWLDGRTNEFRRKVTDWHPSTEPADSLKVQAKAIEIDGEGYVDNLIAVLNVGQFYNSDGFDTFGISMLLQATPRQRSEAAYLTIKGNGA